MLRVADLVVVGAGPGGSVAAGLLARAGHAVELLEARRFPRDKVCGDVLLPELDGPLERLGTSLASLAPDARRLDGCRYVGARGRRASGRYADAAGRVHPWRVLRRRDFDARLAAHAARCGALLSQDHRVLAVEWDPSAGLNRLSVATPAGIESIATPLVLGADGAASRVARDRGLGPAGAGVDRGLCVGLRGYVDWPAGDDGRVTVFGERDLLPGIGWIVPQPDGRANVGLGMVEADRRRRGLRLQRRLERLLADRLGAASSLEGVRGWQLPTGGRRRRPSADGVLLIGDAAGLVDPFTGHGIQNAMRSAVLAAGAAAAAIRRRDFRRAGPLGGYERALRVELGGELRLGGLLQRFHARPGLVDLALARAAASPRWADRFMGLAGHAVPRSEVLGPRFWLDLVRPPGRWPRA